MTDRPNNLAVELALLGLLALLWGSSYSLIKVAVADIPPFTLIAYRVSLAALVLMAVMFARGLRFPGDRRTWGLLLVQSFLNSYGAWTLLAWGQQYVDSGLTGVLNSTSPIFVFFITYATVKASRPALNQLAGAIIGIVGVVLIVGIDALGGLGTNILAQLAVLGGAMLYAGAAIFGQRFSHLPPTVTAASTMLLATMVLVPASVVMEQPWLLRPSLSSIAAATVLSVLCTGLALLVYFRLIRTLGPMGVASQAYLRAGVSVMLGMVFLGETLNPAIAIGIIATLIGVALINLRRS